MFAWAPLQARLAEAQISFSHKKKKPVCGLQSRSFSDISRILSHVQRVHVQLFLNPSQLPFSQLNKKAKGNAVAAMGEDLEHNKNTL